MQSHSIQQSRLCTKRGRCIINHLQYEGAVCGLYETIIAFGTTLPRANGLTASMQASRWCHTSPARRCQPQNLVVQYHNVCMSNGFQGVIVAFEISKKAWTPILHMHADGTKRMSRFRTTVCCSKPIPDTRNSSVTDTFPQTFSVAEALNNTRGCSSKRWITNLRTMISKGVYSTSGSIFFFVKWFLFHTWRVHIIRTTLRRNISRQVPSASNGPPFSSFNEADFAQPK